MSIKRKRLYACMDEKFLEGVISVKKDKSRKSDT
jgi:hypothetical protein